MNKIKIGDRVTIRNVSTGKLRNPERGGAPLAKDEELEVTWSIFWVRRLRDRDIVITTSDE